MVTRTFPEGGRGGRADGFTVIEVVVVSALLLVALTMFTSVLYTVQRATDRQMEIAQANDGARLAIQEIDRQLRSGYVAGEPLFAGAADAVVVYTEARMQSGTLPSCVVWLVTGPVAGVQSLWTRSWPASNNATAITFPGASWRLVTSGIVNGANPPTAIDPFSLVETLSTSGQVISQELDIRLLLNPSTVRSTQVTEIISTIAARNYARRTAVAEVQGGGLNARDTLCKVA